jgi:hypothetical protein
MYQQRQYLIIPVAEVSKIDFNQVCETSAETLRKSVDQSKTFVKWDGESIPQFVVMDEFGDSISYPITDIVGSEGPYSYEEILQILSGPEWTAPMEEV